MELFLDGIVTFPERETFIKLVGDKLYTSSPISSAVLLKIKLFSYVFKSSSHSKNVQEIERKTWGIEITQNTGNSGLQMDLRKTQLCHSTED